MTYTENSPKNAPNYYRSSNEANISDTEGKMTKVLIVTDNTEAIKATVMNLRRLSLDVQLSLYDGRKLASIPNECPDAILCFFTDYIERSKSVTDALKAHFAPRDIPIIGAASRATKINTDHFDSMLFAPMHSSQIANRVRSIIRLGQMEAEISRRMATITENFGYETNLPKNLMTRKFQILFIGKATPAFMIIINALQEKNVNVVAAFTSFTAFDYLHEDQFDAVVMNALEHSEPAISISETMRRNSALYHIPTLFLVDPKTFDQKAKAYESGASDIISADAPLEEMSGRILELANYYRIHEQLKSEFNALCGSACYDDVTKLFNADFLAAHLPRIKEASSDTLGGYASIAVSLKPNSVETISPAFIQSAYAQVGLMIKNLVRMQDVVARIDDKHFVIILPGVRKQNADIITERIKNVVECGAFETGSKSTAAFTMLVDLKLFAPEDYADGDQAKAHIVSLFKDPSMQFKATA